MEYLPKGFNIMRKVEFSIGGQIVQTQTSCKICNTIMDGDIQLCFGCLLIVEEKIKIIEKYLIKRVIDYYIDNEIKEYVESF